MTITEIGPNHQLFVDTLAQIEAHPETWDQSAWHCGSTMCFAGWAAILSGAEWASADINAVIPSGQDSQCHVEHYARHVLGISGVDGVILFNGSQSLAGLYRESARILGIPEEDLREQVQRAVEAKKAVTTTPSQPRKFKPGSIVKGKWSGARYLVGPSGSISHCLQRDGVATRYDAADIFKAPTAEHYDLIDGELEDEPKPEPQPRNSIVRSAGGSYYFVDREGVGWLLNRYGDTKRWSSPDYFTADNSTLLLELDDDDDD